MPEATATRKIRFPVLNRGVEPDTTIRFVIELPDRKLETDVSLSSKNRCVANYLVVALSQLEVAKNAVQFDTFVDIATSIERDGDTIRIKAT